LISAIYQVGSVTFITIQ